MPADAAAGAQAYPEPMRLLRSSRFRRRAGWLAVCLAVAGGVALRRDPLLEHGARGEAGLRAREAAARPEGAQGRHVHSRRAAAGPRGRGPVRRERRLPQARRRFVGAHDRRAAPGAVARRLGDRHDPGRPLPGERRGRGPLAPRLLLRERGRSQGRLLPEAPVGRRRQIFDITLQNHGKAGAPHWLVSYWAPEGGVQLSRGDPRAPSVGTDPPKPAARSGLAVRAGRPDRRRSASA